MNEDKKHIATDGTGVAAPAPCGEESRRYTVAVCAHMTDGKACVCGSGHGERIADVLCKSEGEEYGSVCGCNVNNGQASARTANCNNGAGNGNDNYAGAAAVDNGNAERTGLTSRAASSKTTEGSAATGGQGRRDYGPELPFWGGDGNAESDATATDKEADIWEELKTANRKRKLKGLRRFLTDRRLIEAAFDRTVDRQRVKTRAVKRFIADREAVCDRIERELWEKTYKAEPSVRRVIHKKGKGDKDRNADVYCLYDRVVQTLFLLVVEGKLRRKLTRHVYSGLAGRSLLSNDRRYCMVNTIRQWVAGHADAWVGMTDIRRFYESLRMDVVTGVLWQTIVCPYARWLWHAMFADTRRVPIGGCLSQLLSMVTVAEADTAVLHRYKVRLWCFGDNRLIGGERRAVREAMSFLMSCYAGRYRLEVKGDYQMRRVKDGFRFCKYDYKGSYVHVRAEMRRRAIRAWGKGMKHYAGYRGMLFKTDSARLRHMIENRHMELTNRQGMTVTTQRGDKLKLRDVADGSTVVPVEYSIEPSEARAKEGKTGDMVRLTYVAILADGRKRLCHSTEGSEEVVGFFKLVREGKQELHQKLHVRHDGTKVYFEEFHLTKEEACALICEQLGI